MGNDNDFGFEQAWEPEVFANKFAEALSPLCDEFDEVMLSFGDTYTAECHMTVDGVDFIVTITPKDFAHI